MKKQQFLEKMSILYDQVKDAKLSTEVLKNLENLIFIPKEEGWRFLEDTLASLQVTNIKRHPGEGFGYTVTGEVCEKKVQIRLEADDILSEGETKIAFIQMIEAKTQQSLHSKNKNYENKDQFLKWIMIQIKEVPSMLKEEIY